ncbi:MAG: hypothetical protein IJ370_06105 [Oscillospiraceae bacterium]|nr:hypothetical protein [Oscillospiraceae bacterium]
MGSNTQNIVGGEPIKLSIDIGPYIIVLISIFVALIATVLIFCFILPEKEYPHLTNFLKKVADICNLKNLLVEKILKFIYILSTIFSVVVGFCMLFIVSNDKWMGVYGILIMLVAPILIRLVHEGLMLTVLLVKNVIEINKKMK